ncbi:MAG: hypothetical protein CBD36_000105 [Candidatus Puniceispirillum sp. TMED176]|nr:MAG: hypothetical protein CBD36_000105 [Candidatus Puniceispirillum sp. TMED176]
MGEIEEPSVIAITGGFFLCRAHFLPDHFLPDHFLPDHFLPGPGKDLKPEKSEAGNEKTPSGGASHWGSLKVRDVRGRGTSTALTPCRTESN